MTELRESLSGALAATRQRPAYVPEAQPLPARCPVAYLLKDLDDEDRDALMRAPLWSIKAALGRLGFVDVSKAALARHRRHACDCGR